MIGYDDGRIATLDLTSIAIGGAGVGPPTIEPLATVDHPVDHLLVTDDGAFVVAASADRLSTVDLNGGTVRGSIDLAGIADLAPGGSGSALLASVDDVADPSAAASTLAGILSTDAADYAVAAGRGLARHDRRPGRPGDRRREDAGSIPRSRTGRCPASASATCRASRSRTRDGVAFVDPDRASVVSTILLDGGAHGLAMVTGLDNPRLYATGRRRRRSRSTRSSRSAVTRPRSAPADQATNPLPGPGSLIAYDEASQMVHILGLAPGVSSAAGPGPCMSSSRMAMRSTPTPGCRMASCRRPGGPTSTRCTHRRIASSCSCSMAPGRPRPSTPDRTPSPGACPGSSPGR